jgi:hypothetical protein
MFYLIPASEPLPWKNIVYPHLVYKSKIFFSFSKMLYEPTAQTLANIATYEKDQTYSQEMEFIYSKTDTGRKVNVEMEGECLGSIDNSEDYGQSVLCGLSGDDAYEFLDYEESAMKIIPNGFEFKRYVNDERFFLKLLVKDGKYKASITPPHNPQKFAESSSFKEGSKFMLKFSPNLWINYATKKAGLYLQVKSIVFKVKKQARVAVIGKKQ